MVFLYPCIIQQLSGLHIMLIESLLLKKLPLLIAPCLTCLLTLSPETQASQIIHHYGHSKSTTMHVFSFVWIFLQTFFSPWLICYQLWRRDCMSNFCWVYLWNMLPTFKEMFCIILCMSVYWLHLALLRWSRCLVFWHIIYHIIHFSQCWGTFENQTMSLFF